MSSNKNCRSITTSIKAYVDAEVAGVVNSAPALNTLDELAAALGDDENFATTTSDALGNRLGRYSFTRINWHTTSESNN